MQMSRRTLVRSSAAFAAGGALSQASISVEATQLASLWSAQRYNPGNEGFAPTMEALRENPDVTGQADIAAGIAGSAFLVEGETAYIHGVNGGLAAVNTETNEVDWRLDIGTDTIVPEIVTGGQLVGRSTDGTVYTIDAETGDVDTEVPVRHGRGLGWDGRDEWIATTTDGVVVAGRIGAGEPRWEISVDEPAFRPAVDEGTGRVYVTTADAEPDEVDMRNPETLDAPGKLYALDIEDGSTLWEKSRPGAGICEPVVSDSTVLWAGADGDLRAYDAATGELQWEHLTEEQFYRTPAVAAGTAFVGTQDGELVAVDAEGGDEIGRVEAEGAITSTPVAAGKVVYYGTSSETLHAFDFEQAQHLWEMETRDPVNSLTPMGGGVIVETDVGYTVIASSESEESGADGSGQSSTSPESGQSDADGASTASEGSDADGDDRRGLFSNGAGRAGPASDPINLTTFGFVLSIVGIAYQMLQGR